MAVFEANDTNFEAEVLSVTDQYVLVDFWAEWCGPCKMLTPVINEMAEKFAGKIKVGKLNVDTSPATSQAYSITSIPCNILFKDGKEVDRIIGHLPAPAFEAKLTQLTNG